MQITCPNCQTLNRAGGKFCQRCGKPLPSAAPPVPAQPVYQAPPTWPQPPAQQTYQAPPPLPPLAMQPMYQAAPFMPTGQSGFLEFRGSWTDILGVNLLMLFLSLITLGIYAPWGYVRYRRTILTRTYLNGQPLQFDGTGGQVWVNVIVISLLSMATLGFYALLGFAQLRMLKWDAEHTILPDGRRLDYRGSALDLFAQYLLIGLLSAFTLGIYYFWGYARLRNHIVSNTYPQGSALALQFSGTGSQFLGVGLVALLLSIITLGLYAILGFATVRVLKWDVEHTAVV